MTGRNQFARAGIAMLAAVSLAGCYMTTGGGQITSLEDGGRLDIGFQMRCSNDGGSGHLSGQVQFKDHTNDVAFHGVVDSAIPGGFTCEELDESMASVGITGIFMTSSQFFATGEK